MKCIIIEDDNSILKGLQILLSRYAQKMLCVATAGTVERGYDLIIQHQPQVLFLDVQLSDGSSFDILEKLQQSVPNYQPAILFITAYQEFALKAFKYSALDYLLKPIDGNELQIALKKLNNQESLKGLYPKMELLLQTLNKTETEKKIALSSQTTTHIVPIKTIIRCESDVNYTHFYLESGRKITVSKTLKEFDELLQYDGFERVHQSHLINIQFIKEYDKKDGYFNLTNGDKIPVSTRKKELAQQIIDKIVN
jgi:two-component system LytT family response regulator